VLSSVLLLGFAMGLRHALEADHLATVASLAARSRRARDLLLVAGLWGVGHAAVLGGVCVAAIALDLAIPASASASLELAVGLVLVWLGVDVVRRARGRGLHFHAHRHPGGTWHAHAHTHDARREPQDHRQGHAAGRDHAHAHPSWGRALAVGGLHGAAGSAALLLLAVQALSGARALVLVAVYAGASIAGMLLLSAAISLPLRWGAPLLFRVRGRLELAVGAGSAALGLVVALGAGRAWLGS